MIHIILIVCSWAAFFHYYPEDPSVPWFLVAVAYTYMFPFMCALTSRHPNKTVVFLMNVFLGWTFIGWVASLIYAHHRPPVIKVKVIA